MAAQKAKTEYKDILVVTENKVVTWLLAYKYTTIK